VRGADRGFTLIPPAGGFTLIEVVVALAIVALGMAALLMTLGAAADTAGYLRDKTLAQWIAFNQLTLTRLAGQMPTAGSTDGELDFAGRHWHWKQDVTQQGFPGVFRIDVQVQPADTTSKDQWLAIATGAMGNAVAPSQLTSLYPEPGQTGSSAPTSSQPASSQPGAQPTNSQPSLMQNAPAPVPSGPTPAPDDGGTQ
jgi:general secretion pathway protein I